MTVATKTPFFSRNRMMWFAPLFLLVAAGIMANLGLGVAKDAHAGTATVAATVSSGAWSQTDGCSGAFTAPVLATNVVTSTCAITFGITNAASNLFLVGDASFWTQGGGYYGNGPACALFTGTGTPQIGFKVGTAGLTATADPSCAAEAPLADGTAAATAGSKWRAIPRGGAQVQACQSLTIGNKVCPVVFGASSSATIPAAVYTGTLTFTAS